MNRALLLALTLVLPGCGSDDPSSVAPRPPKAIERSDLEGEWYNTQTSVYPDPSIAIVKFHPAGGIVMTGLDDSAQYGQYQLADDGRLTIRMAVRNHASLTVRDDVTEIDAARTQLLDYPARVIFDAAPVLRAGRLELRTPETVLLFSREDQDKQKVAAATQAFKTAQEAAIKAEQERQRRLAEQRKQDQLKRVRSVLGVKTVTPEFTGAGARACSNAVLRELRRLGWRTDNRDKSDAILQVNLSGIQYKHSAWIGRYYKLTYAVKIRRSIDGKLLATFDGAERATGQGPGETCTDTADDIVDELEDLIDDARG